MRRWLDARAVACALAVCGIASAPRPAAAQAAVACVNCSTVVDQLRQIAADARAYQTQLNQYAMQGRQYANMIQNTISIPRWMWMSLQNDIRMVQGILDGAPYALNSGFDVGALGNYAGYVGQAIHMPDKYAQWSRQANDNAAAILRGLGVQRDQMEADEAALRNQQDTVQLSEGQVQAIQAHAQLTGTLAGEMRKLRQIQLAQSQQEANRAALQADQEAVTAAKWSQFATVPDVAMDGGVRY